MVVLSRLYEVTFSIVIVGREWVCSGVTVVEATVVVISLVFGAFSSRHNMHTHIFRTHTQAHLHSSTPSAVVQFPFQ